MEREREGAGEVACGSELVADATAAGGYTALCITCRIRHAIDYLDSTMCCSGCRQKRGLPPIAGQDATKIAIRPGGVFLVRNGKERKLRSAQRVTVLYDDVDVEAPLVRVEFWEPGFDGTIEVSEAMAAALLSADGQRQLAFLTDEDAEALRNLEGEITCAGHPASVSLGKIVTLLDKRDEIPF